MKLNSLKKESEAQPTAGTLRLSDVPEYAAAKARLDAMRRLSDEAKVVWDKIEHEFYESMQAGGTLPKEALNTKAAAVLRGDDVATAMKHASKQDCIDASNEYQVYWRAVQLAEKDLLAARIAASKTFLPRIRAEYPPLVRRVAAAAAEFVQASGAEVAYRDTLLNADISFSGDVNPMPLGIGSLGRPYERRFSGARVFRFRSESASIRQPGTQRLFR